MAAVTGSPATGVKVVIDQAALRTFLTAPSHDPGRWMLTKLHTIRNLAVGFCPVKTGRLRASIRVDGPRPHGSTGLIGEVGTNVEYAYWVHEGRGPVRPVNARVLRWVGSNGEVIFRPYAGPAQGQPFLSRALESAHL